MLVFFCFFTCLGQSSQIAPLLILLWVRFLFNRFTCNKGRKAIKSKSTQKRLCIKGTLCIKGLNCNWMVPCIIIIMKRLTGSSQLIHAEYSQYTEYSIYKSLHYISKFYLVWLLSRHLLVQSQQSNTRWDVVLVSLLLTLNKFHTLLVFPLLTLNK